MLEYDTRSSLPVVIIGAGPAGLMAAEVLAKGGYRVQVYEQKPSAARKFLMAGKSGLNISHHEPLPQFIGRYDRSEWLEPWIQAFDANAIQQWMAGLGVDSYVGSSGRIFPLGMKAAPLLKAWLNALKSSGVEFFYRHQWLGWHDHQLRFNVQGTVVEVQAQAVILATGGGSWARLGSDAAWIGILQQQQVAIEPLQASNVGVRVNWSEFIRPQAGQPLKRIQAWVNPQQRHMGEAVLSDYGLEGGLIYKLSRELRQQLQGRSPARLHLDLLPDVSLTQLQQRLTGKTGQSLNNIWRKAGLDNTKIHLIREILPKSRWHEPTQVALAIKNLTIEVAGLQPIDEAISTAGGVSLSAINQDLMLLQQPGVFCAGEMLDWDAPTGGYLLTACFATGRAAAQGVIHWLGHAS